MGRVLQRGTFLRPVGAGLSWGAEHAQRSGSHCHWGKSGNVLAPIAISNGSGSIPMHDANRRIFLGGLAALPLAAARGARARTGSPTVGYLSGGEKDNGLDMLYRGPIIKGLAEQGFVAPDR